MEKVKLDMSESEKSPSPLLVTGVLFLFLIICYSVGVPRSSFFVSNEGGPQNVRSVGEDNPTYVLRP